MALKKLGSTKITDQVLQTSANLATEVTGTLSVANGGTGQTVYTNGQLLIGNTTGNTLTKATLTQGSGIAVTNGSGAITVATTAAQAHVTSVGTLSSLTVSGDVTVDTNTLKVDSTNNRVGVGIASPAYTLDSAGYINGTNLLRTTRDASQRIDIDCGGPSYPTSSGIVSFANPGNSKTLIIRATTDASNTTRTSGSLGIDLRTYDSSRLYISEFGNVGVATQSPEGQVDIPWAGTSGKPTILLGATDGGATRTNATQKNFRIGAYHYTNASTPYAVLMGNSDASNNEVRIGGGTGLLNAATSIVMYTGATTTTATGTDRLRITSAGDVLVNGSGWNSSRLCVTDDTGSAAEINGTSNTANQSPLYVWNNVESGSTYFISFYSDGQVNPRTLRGYINYRRDNGTLNLTAASDYRIKTIHGPYERSGEVFDQIQIHEGSFIGESGAYPMAVAHELAEAVPYAVEGEKDAVNEDGTPRLQMVSYTAMIPLMLAEIKSLRSRLAVLEGRN